MKVAPILRDAFWRNFGSVVKVVFVCTSLGFVVKICGYDANAVGLGVVIGLFAWIIGDFADSV